jgi:hypothetical protein
MQFGEHPSVLLSCFCFKLKIENFKISFSINVLNIFTAYDEKQAQRRKEIESQTIFPASNKKGNEAVKLSSVSNKQSSFSNEAVTFRSNEAVTFRTLSESQRMLGIRQRNKKNKSDRGTTGASRSAERAGGGSAEEIPYSDGTVAADTRDRGAMETGDGRVEEMREGAIVRDSVGGGVCGAVSNNCITNSENSGCERDKQTASLTSVSDRSCEQTSSTSVSDKDSDIMSKQTSTPTNVSGLNLVNIYSDSESESDTSVT